MSDFLNTLGVRKGQWWGRVSQASLLLLYSDLFMEAGRVRWERFGGNTILPRALKNCDLARGQCCGFTEEAALALDTSSSVCPLRGHLPVATERFFIVSPVPGTLRSRKQKVGSEMGQYRLGTPWWERPWMGRSA